MGCGATLSKLRRFRPYFSREPKTEVEDPSTKTCSVLPTTTSQAPELNKVDGYTKGAIEKDCVPTTVDIVCGSCPTSEPLDDSPTKEQNALDSADAPLPHVPDIASATVAAPEAGADPQQPAAASQAPATVVSAEVAGGKVDAPAPSAGGAKEREVANAFDAFGARSLEASVEAESAVTKVQHGNMDGQVSLALLLDCYTQALLRPPGPDGGREDSDKKQRSADS
eukprot:gnl/TRDRNA2_/TRDRNA2_82700_c0_seq1.p1 gnl/TRDRNA2_/TRDRNA2_82700_c0~~gnl/TRDRNA2_/TRDRNA2_82700_c0_seq1.p1  ORF type:complete len:225 (+),score=44.87 gnl/TRDRNA2_/TRDRNA2_82700_c0_seq1:158-832(+)